METRVRAGPDESYCYLISSTVPGTTRYETGVTAYMHVLGETKQGALQIPRRVIPMLLAEEMGAESVTVLCQKTGLLEESSVDPLWIIWWRRHELYGPLGLFDELYLGNRIQETMGYVDGCPFVLAIQPSILRRFLHENAQFLGPASNAVVRPDGTVVLVKFTGHPDRMQWKGAPHCYNYTLVELAVIS